MRKGICFLTLLLMLCGILALSFACKSPENSSDSVTSNSSQSESSSDSGHTHSFTVKKAEEKYLKSAATCQKKAEYYVSCECGAIGTETFEYGQLASIGLEYDIHPDRVTCSIIGIGTCKDTDLIIPAASPDGFVVTAIGKDAFKYCSHLTSVTIPNSITSIGYYAFEGCNGLTKVNISSIEKWCSISFDDGTSNPLYYAHNLYLNGVLVADLIIPDNVTSIGASAFEGCSKLTSITIPDSVTYIGGNAFSGCSGLTKVNISSIEKWCSINFGINSNPLSYAHNLYLNGVLITDLIIPDSVTSIGRYMFYGCNELTSITIPDSVTSIDHSAFEGCNGLTKVNISSIEKWCSINFDGETSNPLYYAHNLYLNGVLITDLIIPDTITSIKSYTFNNCSGLTSITIPDSVTSIGNSAFYNCSDLTSITIGNSVTSIGHEAFYGCVKLVEVINNSTLNIVKGAWDNGRIGYYALTVHNGESKIKNIDGFLFITYDNTNYLLGYNGDKTELVLPNKYNGEKYLIYKYAFYYESKIISVTIHNNVTSIGDYAFYGCINLTSFTIPDNVISIGDSTFNGCISLNSITIGNSVTSIGEYAFSGCIVLENIIVAPDNPKYYSLNNCIIEKETNTLILGCKTTIIPNSVTSIDNSAFYGCSGLTSITIPDSVASIGYWAFCYCGGLTTITIGKSVTSISGYAFYGCISLTSITIPDSVTYIGNFAFECCKNLIEIHYNGTIEEWNKIKKDPYWNNNTGDYTVYCTDGNISK